MTGSREPNGSPIRSGSTADLTIATENTTMTAPIVPATLDGWSVLHQMFRIRWDVVRPLTASARADLAGEASALVPAPSGERGHSAFVQVLGHKADLMLVHFRPAFDDLAAVELDLARSRLYDLLEPAASYVSVVELGMYDMTLKLHQQLRDRGLTPDSDAWVEAWHGEMAAQRQRVAGRLFARLPARRHVCFYPMNKRRGETRNWYAESFERRAAMMRDHGVIGRRYAGDVTQVISGSIGFDDWEWGVDLFADDPLVFKRLIYEMRFDEASAHFAEFGPFYIGLQFQAPALAELLGGAVPAFDAGRTAGDARPPASETTRSASSAGEHGSHGG